MTEQKSNTENLEPLMTEETTEAQMTEEETDAQMTEEPTDAQQTQDDIYSAEDIEKNKTMAGLAYLIFFLPLIVCPGSKYAKFHANQALMLLITAVAGNVILGIIPIFGWMLMPIFGLGILIFAVMGLINGFGGKAKRLPLIGAFDILK